MVPFIEPPVVIALIDAMGYDRTSSDVVAILVVCNMKLSTMAKMKAHAETRHAGGCQTR